MNMAIYTDHNAKTPAQSCQCEVLHDYYHTTILCVTIPIICIYLILTAIGIGNLIRFYRVQQISANLVKIYIFSLLSSVCWVLYLAFCEQDNVYHYPPYAFAVYTKILVGIAYQSSIFDLKYIV